ncbi:MAG: hypothetical protein JNL58_14295 [Planctomyces sp.]|nr:hypothetical protein [Planctomyces sp.]
MVTDGPFPETKAVVGGFSIIEVPTREDAVTWATLIAQACRCSQEIREIGFDPESAHCNLRCAKCQHQTTYETRRLKSLRFGRQFDIPAFLGA